MRLIVDFVPNHVGPDHRWVKKHPEYFIGGTADDLADDPAGFFAVGKTVVARGRDPFFPPWPDVVQLNAFAPELRRAAADTLIDIATQADGVRCDMAMLMLNDVFARTWGDRAGPAPEQEYWTDVIGAVRAANPDFVLVAEAYWDLEWPLQQLGFDFCYDKRLYDRLLHEDASSVRGHLHADPDYQYGLVRFLENHDEPRAAAELTPLRERAAAVAVATVPGATLWHEGQFEGWRVRLPVFLRRRPDEPVDEELRAFHLLLIAAASAMRQGDWALCEATGWPDDRTYDQLLAWSWTDDDHRSLVVINNADAPASARIQLPWDDLAGQAVAVRRRLRRRAIRARRDRAGHRGPLRAARPVAVPRLHRGTRALGHGDLEELATGSTGNQPVGHAGRNGDGIAGAESLGWLIGSRQHRLAGQHEPQLQLTVVLHRGRPRPPRLPARRVHRRCRRSPRRSRCPGTRSRRRATASRSLRQHGGAGTAGRRRSCSRRGVGSDSSGSNHV